MKKVLITGASGLLGYNTALAFNNEGYTVRLLLRKPLQKCLEKAFPYEIVFGNIEDAQTVDQAVNGCSYVIHAAAVTEQWNLGSDVYKKINVEGTENIIRACLQHAVSRLIYISTANTMAPGSMKEPGTELNPFSFMHIHSPYIHTKYIAQQKVLEAVEQKGLQAIILNPTFMIGAYDQKPSSGKLIKYILRNQLLFYPSGGKNFVHVKDVGKAAVLACSKGESGDCFLIAGQNLSYKHFFQMVNRIAGGGRRMLPIPGLLLITGGFIGSILSLLTGKTHKLNRSSAYILRLQNYYSGNRASRILGLHYSAIEDAVKDCIDWFNQNNKK